MKEKSRLDKLREYMSGHIIGQDTLINRLLIALLSEGHLLVEGAPGLAKTRAIRVLSEGLEGNFHRIQFTPDLLPADITGTEVFNVKEGSFVFQKGPLFHNLILADEINRAPAKVQSALLEAMAEQQVTVAGTTHVLPDPFLVMATQNPIEQEGTYHLPEAQLDRFHMHVKVDYPGLQDEQLILQLGRREAMHQLVVGKKKEKPQLAREDIRKAKKAVLSVHMADNVERYLLHLVMATRQPGKYSDQLGSLILYGASPRATLALDRCSRAHAWLAGKDYVGPEDIQSVIHDIMRHRLILSFEAQAEGRDVDSVMDEILARVSVP